MTPSLDTLLGDLDTFRPDAVRERVDCYALPRGRLDRLLAASDADAASALVARPWLWEEVLAGSSSYCLWRDRPRLTAWMNRALRALLAAAPEPLPRAVHVDLDHGEPLHSATVLAECLRQGILRPTVARHLRNLGSAESWGLLRRLDGPDLDPELRLSAALSDPVSPRPGLATFLGPDVEPALRLRSLQQILRLPDRDLFTPDLVLWLTRCLDEGFAMQPLLQRLEQNPDAALRRRVFDRLWPAARSGEPPLPWPDVTPWLFFQSLVRTAPAPDLLAVLLDVTTHSIWASSLVQAITLRPDPHLVPALTRWTRTHRSKGDQRLAEPVIKACHEAPPWPS